MKLLLVGLQETTASVAGSSTMSYVLHKNGGGPFTFNNGFGALPGAVPPPPSAAPPPPEVVTESMISSEQQVGGFFRVKD